MAYTKTNLNETTETVAVDMAAEDIENNETTETVAEQNARGYSKTVWNESTPITADKLNKMETGIANGIDKTEQIMEIPITNSEGWQQFRWTRPNHNSISWTRDAPGRKAIEIYNETTRQRLLLLNDDGVLTTSGNLVSQGNLAFENYGNGGKLNANIHNLALHNATGNGQMMTIGNDNRIYVGNPDTPLVLESNTTPEIVIGRSRYQLFHTGNFNPGAKLDAGAFSIHNRDLRVHGKRALVGHATGDGNHLVINYDRDFANGVLIQGLLRTDTIEAGGKLAFSTAGSGGGLNANIHNLTLHTNTGNGQMLTADTHKIYVGNPQTPLAIESSSNPEVKVGNTVYQLYHTGNKPTANQIGALPLSGGIMSGTLYMEYGGHTRRRIASIAGHGGTDLGDNNSKTTIQSNTVPTWWNGSQNRAMLVFDRQDPSDYIVRCGAGLGGAGGYITFTW